MVAIIRSWTSRTGQEMTAPIVNPIFLVPYQHAIETETETGLAQLEQAGFCVWRNGGCSDIAHSRSAMASAALADKREFTHLFWIDSDIVWRTNEDVLTLLNAGKGIIGAPYVTKQKGGGFTFRLLSSESIVLGEGATLVETSGLPAGFLCTARIVYERIVEKLHLPYCNGVYPFFSNLVIPDPLKPGEHVFLSEDFSFCERAQQAGFVCWLNPAIRLWHVGKYRYTWEDVICPSEELKRIEIVTKPHA